MAAGRRLGWGLASETDAASSRQLARMRRVAEDGLKLCMFVHVQRMLTVCDTAAVGALAFISSRLVYRIVAPAELAGFFAQGYNRAVLHQNSVMVARSHCELRAASSTLKYISAMIMITITLARVSAECKCRHESRNILRIRKHIEAHQSSIKLMVNDAFNI